TCPRGVRRRPCHAGAVLFGSFHPGTASTALPRASAMAKQPRIDELLEALRGNDSTERRKAFVLIQTFGDTWGGKVASSLVPTLMDFLQDEENVSYAAEALGQMGPSAAPAVSALTAILKHKDPRSRHMAAQGLGGIGFMALSAVPALKEALTDDDPDMIYFVAEALAQIEPLPSAAVAGLMALLTHEDASYRASAADSLGDIGTDAAQAVPALTALLQDKDRSVRAYAAWALAAISGDATAGDES